MDLAIISQFHFNTNTKLPHKFLGRYSKFHEVDLAIISQFQCKHEATTYESFPDQYTVFSKTEEMEDVKDLRKCMNGPQKKYHGAGQRGLGELTTS